MLQKTVWENRRVQYICLYERKKSITLATTDTNFKSNP